MVLTTTASFHGPRDRLGSALASVAVQGALAALFLWGMGSDARQAIVEPLRIFNILPPPPEPERPVTRPPPRELSDTRNRRFTPREEGGAAPPNLRSRATEIVAPRPVIPLPVTPPVTTALKPAQGIERTSGNADVRGPGTGSGGIGDGSGSGLGGGGGGGGGYGNYSPPRHIRGRLRDSDYPAGLGEAGIQGTVGVVYTVLADGRVTNCRIRSSSGSRLLDETTCDLIERRFFFEPSRDGRGRPVDSQIVENHSWIVEDDPEEPPVERRRRRLF